MNLDCRLAQFGFGCNLFVPAAGNNERQDLSFARRQGIEAPLQFGNNLGLLPSGAIALNPHMDRIEQLLLVQWLGQELNGPGFHCPYRHGNVAMTADEYDWKMGIRIDQHALALQSARPRQSDVEHYAAGCIGPLALKEFLRRSECLRSEVDRVQKVLERLAHRWIIVNDKHDWSLFLHDAPARLDDKSCPPSTGTVN